MKIIKLKREKETFNQAIAYRIMIDGQEIGKLRNGEEKSFEIDNNSQTLHAKIDMGSSEELMLKKLESGKTIKVSGNSFKNKYLKYAGAPLPIIGLTFILKHEYNVIKIFGAATFAIYLLVLIYILIFQRKQWLKIQLKD